MHGAKNSDFTRYGATHKSINALATNTPEVVVSPAANVNGVIVHAARFTAYHGSINCQTTLLAKASAPTSVIDGDCLLSADSLASHWGGRLERSFFVPAGRGLYFMSNGEATGYRSVVYTIV